jgi:transcriptional/translational regulatory protein YebC/TACO1
MDSGFDSKIDTFVRFYGGLFSDSLEFTKSDLTTVSRTTTRLLGTSLRNAVSNPNTNILFVFNGQDLATVQTRMRQSIRNHLGNEDMKIHGHLVICVWCDSAELIKWKEMMQKQEMDLQMQEMARQMQEQKRKQRREMEEKDRLIQRLQEKDRLIQRLLEERADPGRITGGKRKRNGP